MTEDARFVSPQGGANAQRVCAWCGPALVLICAVGLLLPGFVPPPSAALPAEGLAAVIAEHTTAVCLGMILMVIGGALIGMFFAGVSAQMRRIEGPRPILTYVQLLLGACFVMEIIFPVMALQVAAFRPERSPELQQLLNDLCWLPFFGIASTGIVQWVVIGVVILQDTRANPVFPRWAAYFNIWAALMLTPGTVVVFFESGPLSWAGLFVFWLPFTAFFAWLMVMSRLLLRAIRHETAELTAGSTAGSTTTGPVGAMPDDERFRALTEQVADLSHRLDGVDRTLAGRAGGLRLG
jgi:hypothetical protein